MGTGLKLNTKIGDHLPICVSLDLETTGLEPDQDSIIEIGAVKFQGQRILDTYQTLVNPYRAIPETVQRLTGISGSDVDKAPPFAPVAGELEHFIGTAPVVGQNIFFDLEFLSKHGVQLINEAYDTWDLASMLLPYSLNYSLSGLATELKVAHDRPHRALEDAHAAHQVFVSLLERANQLDPAILAYIQQLALRARWPLGRLLGALQSTDRQGSPIQAAPSASRGNIGLAGLDIEALAGRLKRTDRPVRPSRDKRPVDEEDLASYLQPGGLFARAFSGYEFRPQQLEMMRSVARAINGGEHLIVEAGTGVGKSLAYLLPAIVYSIKNGARVVVSTNTINLQEQLLNKDIPAIVKLLEDEGTIPAGKFRAAPLKGRANYLCFRRSNLLARGESLSGDDVRLLGKTLVWLQDTCNGDKGEINLSGKDARTWSRISADEQGRCPGTRGEWPCFLRASRERAEAAHMIVVNHALLLSDLAIGGGLLPEYDHLIIDEAQHLEEEATQQLGTQVSQSQLYEYADRLDRLLVEIRVTLRGWPSSSSIQQERGEDLVAHIENRGSKDMVEQWNSLWRIVEKFITNLDETGGEQHQVRITRSTRSQPGWSDVEIAWEKVDANLEDGTRQVERLRRILELPPPEVTSNPEDVTQEITTWLDSVEELRERLKVLVTVPAEEQRIDWMNLENTRRGDTRAGMSLVFHSAPLNVGAELDTRLFSEKRSVILTSATLSIQGNFDYIRERIGLPESGELLVGSPFDYERAALLLMPEDIPMPEASGHQQALENVLVELGKTLKGHTLVLFTSHSALRGTARGIRGHLETEGIRVLAQGVDGSPRQIIERFTENPEAVMLGTSSFWEGVDLSGGILKALVLARLPFHVPTEPIFAARSAQYEDAFQRYALPQAVLRFRQGMGRLIRGSQDMGSIVVLDRRIIARAYGKAFLESIPQCTVKKTSMSAISGYAADWLKSGVSG